MRDVGGRPAVDFELSDRLVRNTTDLGRARNGANATAAADKRPSLPLEPLVERGRVDAVFRQAQAQERAYSAKLAELDYRERTGELVRRTLVEREFASRLVALRESLEVLADRLSAQVAAEADADRCRRLLREEHRLALAAFVERRELDSTAGDARKVQDGLA